MKNSFWKGLIMGIIGLLATILSDLETFNIWYVVLATVGFTGSYVLKNWLYPNMSAKFTIGFADFVNGLVIVVLMGLSNYTATLLTGVVFAWPALWKAVSIAFIGYFVKTVPSNKGKISNK